MAGRNKANNLGWTFVTVYIEYDITVAMDEEDKPLVWLHGEVKTPRFTSAARLEAGLLLRRLQQGETIGLPQSRPMPSIGPRCDELRNS